MVDTGINMGAYLHIYFFQFEAIAHKRKAIIIAVYVYILCGAYAIRNVSIRAYCIVNNIKSSAGKQKTLGENFGIIEAYVESICELLFKSRVTHHNIGGVGILVKRGY